MIDDSHNRAVKSRFDGTFDVVNDLRPEYVDALDAARWNLWWYVAGAIPPLVYFAAAITRRFRWISLPIGFIACWFALWCAVEYYWNTKVSLAETEAELEFAYADTARVYAPVLFCTPFAAVYSVTWAAIAYSGVWIWRALIVPRISYRELVGTPFD